MWRFFNGVSRAFKNHVHSPRPSAGLYVEEEQEARELNEKVVCPFTGRRRRSIDNGGRENHCCTAKVLNSLFAFKKPNESRGSETTCEIKQNQNFDTGSREERKQEWSCRYDFWRLFQRSHHVLEAISWGTAALWGGDVEKRRHRARLLLRVLFTSPSGGSTVIKSINGGVISSQLPATQPHEAVHVVGSGSAEVATKGAAATTAAGGSFEAESLDAAVEEFQSMCAEVAARSESLLGIEAAARGEFSTAVGHLHSSCKLGNLSACFNLGLCYETGMGVEQDLDKARHYYKMAAVGGHSMALYNLGLMCMQCNNSSSSSEAGCGCGCNRIEGLGLVEKAAKLGLAEAQTYLGIHHIEEGNQLDKAVPYFKAAADQNDAEAQYFLAICYEQGLGVEMNECRAVQLYSQAATAGHELAIYNLAVFHENGLGGLAHDRSAAMELYQRSMELGCEQARRRLEELRANQEPAPDWRSKVENFWQSYLQYHKDEGTSSTHQHSASLSPSASSPNMVEYLHKNVPFFFSGSFAPPTQDKTDKGLFAPGERKTGAANRDAVFQLGSDGDDDDYSDSCRSPLSERSQTDDSFGSISDEAFAPFKVLHKSHSQPNFAIVACNI